MILRQDITIALCALTIPGSCNYIFFLFFFFRSPRESSSLSKSRGTQANDLDNRPWYFQSNVIVGHDATRGYDSGDRGTHYNFRSSGELQASDRDIYNREKEKEKENRERELTTTANRMGQRPREIMRERGEREERRREARRMKMINK